MKKRVPSAVVSLLAVFFLVGCGGGGGGGSTSPYTGITSPSMITDNNAEEIALQAYQAGDLSSSAVTILGVSQNGSAAAGTSRTMTLFRLLKESAKEMPALHDTTTPMSSSPSARSMTVVTFDNTIDDGQGGSMTVHLSIDDQTGEFHGTFLFNGMHGDGGELISGQATVSGNFNLDDGTFAHIRFSFNPVTMDNGTDSATIYGEVDIVSNGPSASASMTIFLQDNHSLETVWISGYTLTLAEGPDADLDGEPDYMDATVTGRIYLPNHGYVDVEASDPTPLRYYAGYSLPSSGVLVATGSGGRSIQLVVTSGIPESPGYHVEADLDADDLYEWRGINRSWQ